jgi:hypothetical protein
MKTVQQARRANNYVARMFFLVFNCEIKIVLNLENQNRTWLRNRTRVKIVRGYKYIYICTVLNLYILPIDRITPRHITSRTAPTQILPFDASKGDGLAGQGCKTLVLPREIPRRGLRTRGCPKISVSSGVGLLGHMIR